MFIYFLVNDNEKVIYIPLVHPLYYALIFSIIHEKKMFQNTKTSSIGFNPYKKNLVFFIRNIEFNLGNILVVKDTSSI